MRIVEWMGRATIGEERSARLHTTFERMKLQARNTAKRRDARRSANDRGLGDTRCDERMSDGRCDGESDVELRGQGKGGESAEAELRVTRGMRSWTRERCLCGWSDEADRDERGQLRLGSCP